MDCSTQTIVLTGATGGIGIAIARLLSDKGATLLLIARNEACLAALADELGRRHHWLSADVTTEQGRIDVISRARQMNATLLINNAGISQFDAIEHISEQQFRMAMELNVMAPICLSKAFLKQVSQGKAKTIMNVGSALGSIGYPFYTSYCASKFALRGFTEALQRELSESANNVLYFAPRATQTAMNTDAVNAMNKQLGNGIDTPQTVAAALVNQLVAGTSRAGVGWPERLYSRLNGLLPEVVDRALSKKFNSIRQFVHTVKA